MRWNEITIRTTEPGVEFVLAKLEMLGIDMVSIIQGRDELDELLNTSQKYWDYAEESLFDQQPAVKAYISLVPENGELLNDIVRSMAELKALEAELGLDLGELSTETRTVDEEDWSNNWKAYFKPTAVGEKLLICPSWEEAPGDNSRAVLKIDPGMAFGTGTHHTTRMCLELLERQIHTGYTVADLGCGSGILSIAAVLMGAARARAVDIDPVAVRVAAENAQLNHIGPSEYFLYTGDLLEDTSIRNEILCEKYDIVLANIVADVIIALMPLIPALMKKDSVFIASGIIDSRLDDVLKAMSVHGLKTREILSGEDWRAILAVNTDKTNQQALFSDAKILCQ